MNPCSEMRVDMQVIKTSRFGLTVHYDSIAGRHVHRE